MIKSILIVLVFSTINFIKSQSIEFGAHNIYHNWKSKSQFIDSNYIKSIDISPYLSAPKRLIINYIHDFNSRFNFTLGLNYSNSAIRISSHEFLSNNIASNSIKLNYVGGELRMGYYPVSNEKLQFKVSAGFSVLNNIGRHKSQFGFVSNGSSQIDTRENKFDYNTNSKIGKFKLSLLASASIGVPISKRGSIHVFLANQFSIYDNLYVNWYWKYGSVLIYKSSFKLNEFIYGVNYVYSLKEKVSR